MKTIAKSSLLVMVLGGLLVAPFLGFDFIEKGAITSPNVLGVQANSQLMHKKEKTKVKVVDQIELKLNLNDRQSQKFYNILPEKYLGDEYQVVPVLPNRYLDVGVTSKVEKNELTQDLLINLSDSAKQLNKIQLFILVLK